MTKSSKDSGKKTKAGKAVEPDEPTDAVETARVTRELEAISLDDTATQEREAVTTEAASVAFADAPTPAADAQEGESGPDAEMSGPVRTAQPDLSEQSVDDDGLEATVQREAVDPTPTERRHHTLAAITRPRGSTDPYGGAPPPSVPAAPDAPDAQEMPVADSAIPDETEGAGETEGEWAIADQPTVSLSPGTVLSTRPQFLDTDEHESWPPRHASELPIPESLPEAAASLRKRAIPRTDRTGMRRLASPDGRPMPGTPPTGVPLSAYPNPRMERYQELHRRRDAVNSGERDLGDQQVTERVRQWWNDLRPGLKQALAYQHEARASGVHTVPAYEQTPTSRLGDVFGRLTASARDLTERAQSAAAPAFKRIHDQAEHAAQAIVNRFDGDTAHQQAPFLGPGRIAVFFRPGVSVGQAQRLLSSNDARPLRVIPRKHGFLAYVLPGSEEYVSTRLRVHPYVRDVLFMAANEYGDTSEVDDGYR